MDAIKKLPREVQVTLGALVLYVIISFFDWQQVSFLGHTYGKSLWHGFGVLAALVAIAYLAWEVVRALNYNVNLGQVTPGMTSAGFAIVLLVLTVIIFLDWSDARHWPAWIGLLLAIAIAVAAFPRAKKEGVELPKMPQNIPVSRPAASGGAAAAAPAAPAPAPEAAPADDPAPPPDAPAET